jgi:hypothetical protein
VGNRPGKAVESPNHDGIESSFVGVCKELIQFRAFFLSARNTGVNEFLSYLPTPPLAVVA